MSYRNQILGLDQELLPFAWKSCLRIRDEPYVDPAILHDFVNLGTAFIELWLGCKPRDLCDIVYLPRPLRLLNRFHSSLSLALGSQSMPHICLRVLIGRGFVCAHTALRRAANMAKDLEAAATPLTAGIIITCLVIGTIVFEQIHAHILRTVEPGVRPVRAVAPWP